MDITLPKKLGSQEAPSISSKVIVIIGANGAGKTRFGSDIENRYNKQTHRISAQKSLSMPRGVSPTSKLRAQSEFLYGFFLEDDPSSNLLLKVDQRWGHNPNTFLLNDYDKLMVLLYTEEFETYMKFKQECEAGQLGKMPITKLDRARNIWEDVLPYRKLSMKAGSIETYLLENPDSPYSASEMSDGERVIFYLIGAVISVPENSIIVIDEPEMHIHKSITKKLWDKIEQERTDCTFIYLTHDIDFASSRQGAAKIWTKGFDGTSWDYEILKDNLELPEQLYLEILGSRTPILFIEGDDSSTDYKLLQSIFTDHTVKPLGSCRKVFETTKAFNEQKGFHNIESFGIIDRDRRTDEEIGHMKNPNIWVTLVAEIENFLLLEEIVKIVAKRMMKDPNDVFSSVKENVISFFETQTDRQALEHTIARIRRIFKSATENKAVRQFKELETSLNEWWEEQDFEHIYTEIKTSFDKLIRSKDYNRILEVFNNKGIIFNSSVASLCDLHTRNDAYLNYIIGTLKQNNEDSEAIRRAIIRRIEKNG